MVRDSIRRQQASSPEEFERDETLALAIQELANETILRGRFVTAVLKSGQDNKVAHGLGREWQGWVVTDKDADARVWRSSTTDKKRYLTLQPSAACTVTVWVF